MLLLFSLLNENSAVTTLCLPASDTLLERVVVPDIVSIAGSLFT